MASLDEALSEGREGREGKPEEAAAEDADDKLMRKVNKGAWGIAKDKADVHMSVERMQNFEEAFLKIRAATGISDIEELVRTFIKNEDQNFSLFNYVNEQTNEIEKLEEQIAMLRGEEHRFAQASGQDVEQAKAVLAELEAKVTATDASAQRFEQRDAATLRTVEQLKQGIGAIFTKLDCEGSEGAEAVTEANMLQVLGVVEQRCNQVLQNYAAVQQKERGRGDEAQLVSVLGAGPATPMGQDLIHVNPPKLDDGSSDGSEEEDEDFRPLTRDELKAKALNRMGRRGNRPAAAGRKGKKGN